MSRNLTASMVTASTDEVIRPFIAVELTFSTGIVRLNGTDRTLSFDAGGGSPTDDFLGAGQMADLSLIEESAELKNYEITMSLRGIPNDLVSLALGSDYQGKPCRVWLGFLDSDFNVIDSPTIIFDGLMDSMAASLGETATIELQALSHLARWEEPPNQRYTDEEQQNLFPGDLGLEFVSQMVEKEITWRINVI